MSHDDKALSLRDSSAVSNTGVPTVASVNLRVLLAALDRIGHDSRDLAQAAGLTPADLDDPDARFPIRVYVAILTRAQLRRPTKNLALHVAQATPIGAYPVIDYLVITSESVGHGFEALTRYFAIAQAPVDLRLDTSGDPIRVFVDSPFNPWGAEYTMALHLLHTRHEVAGEFQVAHIAFLHQPDDAAEWQQTFRCPISTRAAWTGFALPRSVWECQYRHRNANLRIVLEQHAKETLKKLPPADDIVAAVRTALVARVTGGDTRIGAVARHLAMTPRTLQRQLAGAQVSYHELRDDIRRRAAEDLLEDPNLSIGEIAYLLGYTDRAALHRAVKRWSDLTPKQLRARRRLISR